MNFGSARAFTTLALLYYLNVMMIACLNSNSRIDLFAILYGDGLDASGTKWWSSGAVDERCKVGILLGKVDSGKGKSLHQQQSMLVVLDHCSCSSQQRLA